MSAPIINERREVAVKLREPFDVLPQGRYFHASSTLFGMGLYARTEDGLRTGIRRLADLIEPEPERTCRNVGGDKWEFMCSECGGHTHGSPFHIPDAERDELARALGGRIASLHGSVPRFCPNCGARVVPG